MYFPSTHPHLPYFSHVQVNRKRDQFRDTFVQFIHNAIPELALPIASVAAIADEHFIFCTQCGGDLSLMTQKRGSSSIRFLQCSVCNLSFALPAKGTLRKTGQTCPVCKHVVLSVQNDLQMYMICPYCYSNPSSTNTTDIENLHIGARLPCFRCRAACPFAQPLAVSLGPCYHCRQGTLQLKQPHMLPTSNVNGQVPSLSSSSSSSSSSTTTTTTGTGLTGIPPSIRCTNTQCHAGVKISMETVDKVTVTDLTCPRCQGTFNSFHFILN